MIPVNLTLEEATALLEWHQRRYHEMVQSAAFNSRLIQSLRNEIEELKRGKPKK